MMVVAWVVPMDSIKVDYLAALKAEMWVYTTADLMDLKKVSSKVALLAVKRVATKAAMMVG